MLKSECNPPLPLEGRIALFIRRATVTKMYTVVVQEDTVIPPTQTALPSPFVVLRIQDTENRSDHSDVWILHPTTQLRHLAGLACVIRLSNMYFVHTRVGRYGTLSPFLSVLLSLSIFHCFSPSFFLSLSLTHSPSICFFSLFSHFPSLNA